jgi:hypothetical protein
MNAYESVKLFEAQVRRATGLKVVLMPSPIKEPGPHVKLAVRKVVSTKAPRAAQGEREVRLFASLDGNVESETGLKLALEACEKLAVYLVACERLEDAQGAAIANTRVISKSNDDDGILQDPDKETVAWLDDLHYVSVFIPA